MERQRSFEIAEAFYAASRSGDMTAFSALLTADVSFQVDGGGKRPAWQAPIFGFAQVMKAWEMLAVLIQADRPRR